MAKGSELMDVLEALLGHSNNVLLTQAEHHLLKCHPAWANNRKALYNAVCRVNV